MASTKSTIQQEFDELMQHIESIYSKEQLAVISEYADSCNMSNEEVEILTVSNSSVYGY